MCLVGAISLTNAVPFVANTESVHNERKDKNPLNTAWGGHCIWKVLRVADLLRKDDI